jgi:integrase
MSSVTRRGKVWHACYRDPSGERVTRSTKMTDKKKAREVLAKWEATARGELDAVHVQKVMADIYREATGKEAPTFTVRGFLNQWCEDKSARGAVRAAEKYQQIVREFLAFLGSRADLPLRQLAESDLSDFVKACGKKVRARTANKKLTLLASALRDAWQESLLPDDICKRLKKLKLHEADPLKRQPFTQEQVNRIIEHATGEWKGITTLGAYTGQRLGDIVNFRWEAVQGDMLVFTSRKTKRPMRVPLHPMAKAWLVTNRGNAKPDDAIFPQALAKFETHRGNVGRLSDEFYGILADLELLGKRTHHTKANGRASQRSFNSLSFHSFRHYFTSLLHSHGVAAAIVRDIIGHESEVVNRIYTSIDDQTKLLGVMKCISPQPSPPNTPPTMGAVIEPFPVPTVLKEASNG